MQWRSNGCRSMTGRDRARSLVFSIETTIVACICQMPGGSDVPLVLSERLVCMLHRRTHVRRPQRNVSKIHPLRLNINVLVGLV